MNSIANKLPQLQESSEKSSEKYGYVRNYGTMIKHPSVLGEAAFVMPLGPVEMSDSNR